MTIVCVMSSHVVSGSCLDYLEVCNNVCMLFNCHMTDEIVDVYTSTLHFCSCEHKATPPTRINLCVVPPQVLTRYLQEIEDLEVRLQLATEAEMFDIGIDVSVFLMAWTS